MELGDAGQARVRGYLYVLERSLRTFLPSAVVADAVREIEGHIVDRVSAVDAVPDERTALERVLVELGPPLRVARAYSAELALDEAVTTGRIGAMARSVWHVAVNSVAGFFGALGLVSGYMIGLSFFALGVLQPIFPNNIGFTFSDGRLTGFGGHFPLGPADRVVGGSWIVPVCVAIGLALVVVTHRAARRMLGWFRGRRKQRMPFGAGLS